MEQYKKEFKRILDYRFHPRLRKNRRRDRYDSRNPDFCNSANAHRRLDSRTRIENK